jgi:hypothetical protein
MINTPARVYSQKKKDEFFEFFLLEKTAAAVGRLRQAPSGCNTNSNY